ncbi:MAG TPA: hypothetical protein VET24_11740 [Actinomycetota bacterium]|nr:hypothetical protein [Actinomycetota bacterium]
MAIAVGLYWPLVHHVRTQFWADSGDGAAFIWNYWSVPRAVLSLHNPFVTTAILHPVGVHTAFETNVPLWSMLSWPLARVFGLSGASVVIGLFAVVASGLGAYLLALRLRCPPWVAFFAGVAFELLPYRTNRIITHLNLIHTEFLVFGIIALLDVYRKPGRRQAIVLGAVLGLTFLTDFTYALMLGVAIVILVAMRLRSTLRRQVGMAFLQAGALTAVISLPLLVPAISDVRHGEYAPPPGLGGAQGYSADLVSWIVPYDRQPLWGHAFATENANVTGGERVEFTGVVVLGLALAGLFLADRRKRDWLVLAVAFGLLSFGPGLHVNGKTGSAFTYEGFKFSIPMPYLLLNGIPGFKGFRAPARFGVVASLALIMLAALALERLTSRWPRGAIVLPALATLLVVVEFLPPTTYLAMPVALPAVYQRMASDPDPGAVLDVPLQFRTGYGVVGDDTPVPADDSRFMYAATVHRRAMAGGTVPRLPDKRLTALTSIPVYHQILELEGDQIDAAPGSPPSFTTGDLNGLGIRFIVDHHENPMPGVVAYLDSLHLPVYAENGSVTVWKVPPPGGLAAR